jgi:hypothetical protein
MGFMRKALFLGTGGLSGAAGDRTAKAEAGADAEAQLVVLSRMRLRGEITADEFAAAKAELYNDAR